MNATERRELAQAVLALEVLEGQLATMGEGNRPVPTLNVQGVAYLLGLTVRRLGSVLGSREEVQAQPPRSEQYARARDWWQLPGNWQPREPHGRH